MKMKKLLFLTIIIAVLTGALVSCDGGDDVLCYGVVEQEGNILLVNIPNVGLCEIPEAEKIVSDLDGNNRSVIESGDLIEINFGRGAGVDIMEIYPARFAAAAEKITIRAEDIEVEYEYNGTIPVCYLTQPTPTSISNAVIGDFIAFSEGEGDSADDVYCYGEVYMTLPGGKMVVKLELVNGISDFLSKYPSAFKQSIVEAF